MTHFSINRLNMLGSFNSNRYLYNFIKYDKKANGIIIFPIDYSCIDLKDYVISKCLLVETTKCNQIFGINSLSVIIHNNDLINEAKKLCVRLGQSACIIKDYDNKDLSILEVKR